MFKDVMYVRHTHEHIQRDFKIVYMPEHIGSGVSPMS